MSAAVTGRVAGKVAVVTGAARGQGRSHCVRLAQEGADVIALDICGPASDGVGYPPSTADDLAETVALVKAAGARVHWAQADTRDHDGLRAAVAAGVEEFGRLDIVVANAGIVIMRHWHETTPKMWQDTIDVNLTGTWNTVMATAPHLIAAGGGSIILISSTSGLKGVPFLSAYVASKHGVTGLARAFASELAQHDIRVNSVHPTGVDTPMLREDESKDHQRLFADNPRPAAMFTNMLPVEVVQPADISNAVVFLASDEARYVTATAMTVDAGNTQY